MSPCLPQYALQEVEALSLQQMLEFGRAALFDSSKILTSARYVQKEVYSCSFLAEPALQCVSVGGMPLSPCVQACGKAALLQSFLKQIPIGSPFKDNFCLQLPKRLARRLMDLQFLPYIVVTNPYIKRVYNAYHHAFHTLRQMPEVSPQCRACHFPCNSMMHSLF